jgi:ribonucleotide reductase alpha subunit
MVKIYSKAEVKKATLAYFKGDELAANVAPSKYLLKNKSGEFVEKTPDDMHDRIADEFYRIESKYPNPVSRERIREALSNFKRIVPQGSPMYGIGNNYVNCSLSNCLVISSPDDNISSIVNSGKDLANLSKARCGVGIDISTLRPEGMAVNNAAETTSGAWSFADFYSYVIRMIGQNGRRGALMLTMDVRHPDVLKFATSKVDRTKVTGANISVKLSNDFMAAVRDDAEYVQQWPVDSESPKITKVVKAREVWEVIVKTATETAEPGLLFWDTMLENLPAECYADVGFKHVSTNPCFSGDTNIAVADGRNYVTIKQLAEEGRDVPVYSVDPKNGKVSIKMGRNPRLTGHDQKIVRVTLDDGSFLDVTPNHKFPLRDGGEKQAKDLVKGDSLFRFTKYVTSISKGSQSQYLQVYCDALNPGKDKVMEHRLIAQFCHPDKWVENYDKDGRNGWLKGGLVVHHKDYNTLNNSPDNLEIMSFQEHNQYHAENDNSGESNGRYSGFSNKQIEQFALQLTQDLGHRFSQNDWVEFAERHGLPKNFSGWRREGWFKDPTELAKWAASEIGLEYIEEDPRLVRTYRDMLSQGYESKIISGEVFVVKNCEWCSENFDVNHNYREQAFCSHSCATSHINSCEDISKKRVSSLHAHHRSESEKKKQDQMKIYSKLKFDLGKAPQMKDWEYACREAGVSYRVGAKFGFKSYTDLKQAANDYNHKVVSVDYLEDNKDVYNITVDDNHTVGIVTNYYQNKLGNTSFTGVFAANCGELILSGEDSCRLISINLKHYVKDPFQESAFFDLHAFSKDVCLGMRMMDNLVDLEIEKVQKIYDSCDTPDEKELWSKVLIAAQNGRRTGLGTHGLGDAIARLGIRYDSKEALEVIREIYQTLRDEAYKESVNLAKERGAFPVFNWEKEKDNVFIKRLPQHIQDDIAKYGRRNISLLTMAPTGSVSIMSQTSSGVEPVFKNSFIRRKKIAHNDSETQADFVDALGDRWQEFEVFHHNIQEYFEIAGKGDLPDFFVEADQIKWEARVDLQGTIQEYIDHSISSTINLPRGTSPEVVGGIYMRAWESGLKGVTVYVDGCRDGVLVTKSDKDTQEKDLAYREAVVVLGCVKDEQGAFTEDGVIKYGVRIPDSFINGRTQTIRRERNKYYLKFSYLENCSSHPIALWIYSNNVQDGEYVSLNRGVRSLQKLLIDKGVDVDLVLSQAGKLKERAYHENLGKMISMCLRHNLKIPDIIHALEGIEGDYISSTLTAVRKFLATAVPDGEIKIGAKCLSCGSSNIIFEGGCDKCLDCGSSGCS